MKTKRALFAMVCLASAASLALASCGSGPSTNKDDASNGTPTIRLQALDQGTSGLALKTVEELGLDKKHGFKGDFQYVGSDASSQHFLQGLSDVNFNGSPDDAALASDNSYDVVAFSGEALNHAVIIAPKDSTFTDIASLKGKKIGWYGSDSTAAVSMGMLLKKYHDIDLLKDFKFAKSSPSALVKLLASKQVDAIITFQPWVSWAESEVPSGVKVVYDPGADWNSQTGGNLWMTALQAKREWLEKHPDESEKILAAWCDAAEYLNSDIAEAMQKKSFRDLFGVLTDDGVKTFVEWVTSTQPFKCGWEKDQIANANEYLDAIAALGKTFSKNTGTAVEKLNDIKR